MQLNRRTHRVPLSVVVRLVKVVDFYARYTFSRDSHLNPALVHRERNEALVRERVVHQEPGFFVGPEIQTDVQVLRSLAATESDKGLVRLEGDRDGGLIDRAVFDDAA